MLFTALPHTWYTRSLGELKARSVGVIATLLPVYGARPLFLGEIPAFRTLLGGGIILAAVVIETWRVMARGHGPVVMGAEVQRDWTGSLARMFHTPIERRTSPRSAEAIWPTGCKVRYL